MDAEVKNGMAILEEFLQEKYVENFGNSDKYDEKLDSMLYETTTNKYFQRAANKDMFFLDSSTYKEYFLIEKSALPKEIQKALIGGDNSLTGKTIYASFVDVYGVTSDLKVYYCKDGYESWFGTVDTAKETDLNKTIADSNSGWGDVLGVSNKNITVSDIKSVNGKLVINRSGLDLKFLVNFPKITEVRFTTCNYDNLEGLGYLTDVKDLYFEKGAVIDDYGEIGRLQNLSGIFFTNSTDTEIEKCFSKEETGIGDFDFDNLNYILISNDDSRYYWEEVDKNNGTKNANITTIQPIRQLSPKTKSKVKYINISLNDISSLEGMNEFSNLTFLKARNNSLTTLKGIEGLKNLKYLLVQNNVLGKDLEEETSINDDIDSLSYIAKINERKGGIKDYTFTNTLTNLYYLNLSNNPNLIWVNYVKNCDELKYLYLTGNTSINLESLLGLKSKINEFYTECKFDSKYNLSLKDKNSTSLDLTNQEIEKNVFLTLGEYTKLKSLNLRNVKIYEEKNGVKTYLSDTDLNTTINSVLSKLTNIYALSLSSITNLKDISFVKKMKYLNNVNLGGTSVTTKEANSESEDIGLELLNNCKNMFSLAIDNPKIDLSKIQPTLNILGIDKSDDKTYPEGFSGLVQIEGTGSGSGLCCTDGSVLQTLSKCTELERFFSRLQSTSFIGVKNLELDLSRCSKLRELDENYYKNEMKVILPSSIEILRSGPQSNVVYDFSNCQSLSSLRFSQNPKGMDNVTTFKNFSSLKELQLQCYKEVFDSFVKNIDIWKKFSNLHLLWIMVPSWDYNILTISSLNALEKLKDLENLEEFRMRNVNISDNNWTYLSNLSHLKSLTLEKCNVTDVSCLYEMNNLESLVLTNSSVTNGLYALHNKTKLAKLYLDGTPIGDISVYDGKNYNTIDILLGLRPGGKPGGILSSWKLSSYISSEEKARME